MMKRCKGCGVVLQDTDQAAIGYTPDMAKDFCKRCFRITHYDDVMISMKQGIDADAVLKKIEQMDALVIWVVDLFDFEANLIRGMNRRLRGKDIILAATKRDLLPDTLSNEKLIRFLSKRLKEQDITVNGIVICGDLIKHAFADYNRSSTAVKEAITRYRRDRDVVIMGMANAGKSTLLNALIPDRCLTTSRHPGTTLDFNALTMDDYRIYDTPGLTRDDSLLTHVDDEWLKTVIPQRALKARIYQLRGNQTLSVGGLVRLDLFDCENVSCVGYFADSLMMHRSKQEKADTLWEHHLGELLSPSLNEDFHEMKAYHFTKNTDKIDLVIHGLGWFCISGNVSRLQIYIHKDVNVTCRKAMM